MNIAQIEDNLQKLSNSIQNGSFIYDLLSAYGMPKASITRLQKGGLNLSKTPGEIIWKKKLFFKEVSGEDLHNLIDNVATNEKAIRHDPRFLIVTDYKTLLAIDRKTGDTLDVQLLDIAKHFDFFLPWAGMEKKQQQSENPADVKAAEKMARLYDEIRKDNPTSTPEEIHNLNVFLSRLLFCFFAEDTGIFAKSQFTNAIASHTQQDGSDLDSYLNNLFEVMNIDKSDRRKLPAYLDAFPYVNGGLFRNIHYAPVFSKKSRLILIECGSLQWKDIHPDIFGSMIQAVVTPEDRGGFGMHYTSVPNIMKVIEPLFLDELKDEFDAGKHEPRKLIKLLERLSKIKIFDPACGSGNFLIIAYKELRTLEIKILQQLQSLQKAVTGFEPKQMELIPKTQLTLAAAYRPTLFSRIELSQFYGIELDDFAHEIAILSLWLAQHQMNMQFKEVFGSANPTLPLQAGGNIIHGNATRIDWGTVCQKDGDSEIYILGNPPYLGARNQNESQKADMSIVFNGKEEYKDSDYVLCWFLKAARFIEKQNAKFAFVTTSSISQGSQIGYFWPEIYQRDQEIYFAYQAFKWTNNARDKAGIICVIIGVQNSSNNLKKLINPTLVRAVNSITPYLIPGKPVIVHEEKRPLGNLPLMVMGTMARDGGNLILSENEKDELLRKYPLAKKLLKYFLGADEYIKGKIRYCLWIEDEDLEFAMSIPEIQQRISNVFKFRIESKAKTTNQYSKISHKFAQRSHQSGNSIIVPSVSSEKREYIPIGFLDDKTVISNLALAVYNVEYWLFAILTSKIHNIWVHSIGGYLGTSIRYSITVCYNTFPFPEINNNQRQELERNVYNVLSAREAYSEKTLAELYDPDKMPSSLKEAHHQLDLAVERCYRSKPFETDEERLAYLFKLYEQRIAEKKLNKGELIFEQTKINKKGK